MSLLSSAGVAKQTIRAKRLRAVQKKVRFAWTMSRWQNVCTQRLTRDISGGRGQLHAKQNNQNLRRRKSFAERVLAASQLLWNENCCVGGMNVYDFADKLLEKLSGMRITMENLAVNEQSYDYISNLLTANELFPNYERLNLLKIAKSDEMATKHRLRGNELFRDRKYFQALCAYNESLCFARPDSEAIGLGFANRSAVFLEIGEFGRCRKNIELAKRFKYPEKNFYKLDKREQSCPETNNLKPEECDSLHLTLKPNRKYPFIADCLKMKRNVNFGRHIVTNSELKTGEVIAIEPSFSALLLPSCLAKRCTNCLGQFQLDLLPCPRCTSGKNNK